MNLRAQIAAVGVLVTAGGLLAACGSSSPSASSSAGGYGAISVQLSWIKNSEFSGEFIADSKGYYKDAGFSSVNLLSGPVAQEQVVATGQAQFGLSDAISTGAAISKSNFPIKIVGAAYQKNPFTILSLADKGNILKPSDLCGKRIGVQAPNTALFNALVAANNLTCSITIVPNDFSTAPLEDKQIDGLVAYQTNEALLVKDDGFKTANLPFATNGLPFVAEAVITTDAMIKDHPDEVKAFLKAEILGWKAACADPTAGPTLAVGTYGKDIKPALVLAKEIEQSKEQCTALINDADTKANGLFTITPALIAASVNSLKVAKIPVAADQLFDTSLITDLYKQDPSLK